MYNPSVPDTVVDHLPMLSSARTLFAQQVACRDMTKAEVFGDLGALCALAGTRATKDKKYDWFRIH
jgi:hypothetical protein